MAFISKWCESCKQFSSVDFIENQLIICPHCKTQWEKFQNLESIFNQCPICGCRQFYLQKDFNQALGCFIMSIGIILVPWTFALSLPFFALVDWLLYKKIPFIAVCYKCLTEFHGFKIPEHFKTFMHHIGAKYDKK